MSETKELVEQIQSAQQVAHDFWKIDTDPQAAGFYRGQSAAYLNIIGLLNKRAQMDAPAPPMTEKLEPTRKLRSQLNIGDYFIDTCLSSKPLCVAKPTDAQFEFAAMTHRGCLIQYVNDYEVEVVPSPVDTLSAETTPTDTPHNAPFFDPLHGPYCQCADCGYGLCAPIHSEAVNAAASPREEREQNTITTLEVENDAFRDQLSDLRATVDELRALLYAGHAAQAIERLQIERDEARQIAERNSGLASESDFAVIASWSPKP